MKIGLIGCGKQAPKHIAGLSKVENVDVIVCDIDADRARATGEKFGLNWTADFGDLLSDPSVEAVDIATPTPTHAQLAGQAFEAGKHVFCEKPLCEALDEAVTLQKLADANDLIGMVGYVYRYAPVFEAGRHLFTQNAAGSLPLGDTVSAWFRIGGRGEHEVWKHRRASAGGASREMLVHMLDLAIWYFGPVRTARYVAHDLLRPVRRINGEDVTVDAEDFVLVQLTMNNGLKVFVQADLVTPVFSQYTEIQFERGSFMGSIQPDMPSYIYSSSDTDAYKAGKNVLAFGPVNLFEQQMAEFCRFASSRQLPDRNSLKDSLMVMEAFEMLQKTKVEQ